MNGAGGVPVRCLAPARKPRIRLPCCRSISRKRGNSACIESRSASPPWIPASSGSARYSTASRPKRRPMNDAIDSSPAGGRAGRTYSAAMRHFPRSEKARVVTNGDQSVGIPKTDASGIWRSRPPRTRKVPRCACGRSRCPMPSSRQSSMAAGFCVSNASGPASMTKPSTRSVLTTPPSVGAASSRRNGTRRRPSS